MNKENKSLRDSLSVMNDVDNATCILSTLPIALHLLVDRYNLDKNNLNEMETYDYLAGRHDINEIIYLVETTIFDVMKSLEQISAYKSVDDVEEPESEV